MTSNVTSLFNQAQTGQTSGKTLHLTLNGVGQDIAMDLLEVGAGCSDVDVKTALARHLDTSAETFRNHVVERLENGNLTVRPQAVFG